MLPTLADPKPLRKASAETIFEALAARIVRCELQAGERLTEERLSLEFGVSRTPVREALRRLEHAGHVERVRPRGYAVRGIDLASVDHVYGVRCVLEELVVELAAPAAGSAEFDRLMEAARTANEPGGHHHSALREAFHEDLAALSGNPELLRILRDLNVRIYACRRLDALVPERSDAAQREHLEILELLAAGGVDGARAAMREHIERSRATVRLLLHAGIKSIEFVASGDDGKSR